MSNVRRMLRVFEDTYRQFFSVEEIEKSLIVQWMFGASLFYFFICFGKWMSLPNITVETAERGAAMCWPYFQNCSHLYFLHDFPYGYSQNAFYMLLYGVMCLIVYCMWKKEWTRAHLLLTTLFMWKAFVVFVLSFSIVGPYDYYHLILTAVLLFVPFKEYFLKVAFVFMYFMSATVKFTPAWVLGTYFSSMKAGLPLFPSSLLPLFTNIVIFAQVIDCWFLLSRHWILQRLSFAFGVVFHLFSGVLVSYDYPSVALPALIILFGPLYRHTPTPFSRRAFGGWTILFLVAVFQIVGFAVSPNRFLTLEGHRYGMFMFEANHQCIITTRTYSKVLLPESHWEGLRCDGLFCSTELSTQTKNGETVTTKKTESASAWNRCDPYQTWSLLRAQCGNPSITHISMQFDHSINGGPFYRIVDEPSICDLTYAPFSHNTWIKVPPEAPVIGYPVQNFYSNR